MGGIKITIIMFLCVQISCLSMEKKGRHYSYHSPTSSSSLALLGFIGGAPAFGRKNQISSAVIAGRSMQSVQTNQKNNEDELKHSHNITETEAATFLRDLEAQGIDKVGDFLKQHLQASTICLMLPELIHTATVHRTGFRLLRLEERVAVAQVCWMATYVATLYDAKSKRNRDKAMAKLNVSKDKDHWWQNKLRYTYFTMPNALQIFRALSLYQAESFKKYIF